MYAVPVRPARAQRPTLCTKSFDFAGKLKLITLSKCGISKPRAATSVTIKTWTLLV